MDQKALVPLARIARKSPCAEQPTENAEDAVPRCTAPTNVKEMIGRVTKRNAMRLLLVVLLMVLLLLVVLVSS